MSKEEGLVPTWMQLNGHILMTRSQFQSVERRQTEIWMVIPSPLAGRRSIEMLMEGTVRSDGTIPSIPALCEG